MTTIVRHLESGREYVLVGTGLGMFRAVKPHWFLGDLGKTTEEGVHSCVAAADAEGLIQWFDSDDLVVVSVDGQAPGALLGS